MLAWSSSVCCHDATPCISEPIAGFRTDWHGRQMRAVPWRRQRDARGRETLIPRMSYGYLGLRLAPWSRTVFSLSDPRSQLSLLPS